jgi:hypothetical protein
LYPDQLFPQQLSLQSYPEGKADGDLAYGLKGFTYDLRSNMAGSNGEYYWGEQHLPIAWYKFETDITNEGTLPDLSGNGYHLSPENEAYDRPSGSMDSPSTWKSPPGFPNKSAKFGGDILEFADSGTVFSFGDGSVDSPFSVSAWYKPERDLEYRYMISKYDSAGAKREWLFYLRDDNTLKLFLFDETNNKHLHRTSVGTVDVNKWHHLAAAYDGSGSPSGISLYINGVLAEMVDGTKEAGYVAMSNTTSNFAIGNRDDEGSSYRADGHWAEAVVWPAKLNSEAIAALYSMKETTGATGTVGYFSMPGFVAEPNRIMAPFVESAGDRKIRYRDHFREFTSTIRGNQRQTQLTGSLVLDRQVPEMGTRFRSSNCGFISGPNYSKITGDSFADDAVTHPGTDSIAFAGTSRS